MDKRKLSQEEMNQYKHKLIDYEILRKEIDLHQAAEILNEYQKEWSIAQLAQKWGIQKHNLYDFRNIIKKKVGDILIRQPRTATVKKEESVQIKKRTATKKTEEKKSIAASIYEEKIKELEEQIKAQQQQLEEKDRELEEATEPHAIAPAADNDLKIMLELVQEQTEQVAAAVMEAKEKREDFHGIAFKFEGEFTADTLKKRLEKVIHMVEGEPSLFDITLHVYEKQREDITPKVEALEDHTEQFEAFQEAEVLKKQIEELTMTVLTVEEELKDVKERTHWANEWENGYSALKNGKEGLHHPQSEYANAPGPEDKKIPERSVVTRHGVKCFQAYYHCPKCKDRGKTYTPKGSEYVNCKRCGEGMKKQDANEKGFPEVDAFGNVYVAGEYIAENNLKQA